MRSESVNLFLSDNDKNFIRSYVAEAQNDEEKKRRRKECAEQFGVSLPTISAVTAWTKIRANKTNLISSSIEIKPVTVEESVEGCHANYDNPIKQLWRQKWKEFIAKYTLPGEREKMRVICLPGKKCLEIPLYLELGFKPENITGVEGGDEMAKREFYDNAYRYKIVPKLGRLEDILVHDSKVYDVVSLDFTGPLSKTCLDIIKMVPLAPAATCSNNVRSLFMINLLAKRETQTNQSCIDFYASFARPELMQMFENQKDGRHMNLEKFKKVFGYVTELADKAISGEKCYDEAELKDKRNIGLLFILTSLIAKKRRDSESIWGHYKLEEVPIKLRQDIDFGHYAALTLTLLLDALSNHVDNRMIDFLTIGAPQLIEIISGYKPFLYELEQYQYSSPVNNANAPFLTEMYQFMTPMADYIRSRYFVRFFVDTIFWQGLNEGKQIYVEIRDKHGRHKYPGNGLHGKDTIGFIDEQGFVISTIVWHRFMEVYELLMAHIHKDKAMVILDEGQNSRINLSD